MDDSTAFLKILTNYQINPRSKGYKNHTDLIKKLQNNGIWEIMSHSKLTIEERRAFCEVYDVPNSTVRTWNNNLMKDPKWVPKHLRLKRLLTNDEENSLAEILRQIIDAKIVNIDNSIFRSICLDYYYKRHDPDFTNQVHFCDKWIRLFRKRHRFSGRKYHKKRRPKATDKDIESFLNKIEEIISKYPKCQIFNCDETFWRISQSGDYTWAEVGSTDISVNGEDEKKGFTVLCTIDAAGNKYAPILISIGTTQISERNWFGGGRNIFYPQQKKQEINNQSSR